MAIPGKGGPEEGGQATFRDVIDGQTVHEQVDENTGMSAQVILEADEKKQPRIEVKDEKGRTQKKYLLPSGAHLMVEDGADVSPAPGTRTRASNPCGSYSELSFVRGRHRLPEYSGRNVLPEWWPRARTRDWKPGACESIAARAILLRGSSPPGRHLEAGA